MVKKHGWQFYKSGVKVNAACYFTYDDHDVDFINVYIPKNTTFKSEVLHNADQTATISANPSSASTFSLKQVVMTQFKNPENASQHKIKRNIASEIADIILRGPLRDFENIKYKKMTCASYALRITQVSELLSSFNDKERTDYFKKYSQLERGKLIEMILSELNDTNTKLGAAFSQSELCKLNPSVSASSDVPYMLDKLSDNPASFFANSKKSEIQVEATEGVMGRLDPF